MIISSRAWKGEFITTSSQTPRSSRESSRLGARALRPGGLGVLAIAVFLVSFNLRPAVASIGPVLTDVRDSLGLSTLAISVLTALPVVCFGAVAPLGPWLSRRLGLSRAIGAFSVVVLVGLVVRIGPDAATLFLGTFLAAAAIAALNVLLPALIKRDFPRHTGTMMSVYTVALTGSAAISAGLTVPFADAFDGSWRGGLGVWAVPAAVALLAWAPQFRMGDRTALRTAAPGGLLRDRVAWMVTLYFATQSLTFYAAFTWLPTLFEDHGFSETQSGAFVSVTAGVQAAVSLVVPVWATRLRTQTPLVIGSALFTAAGFALLLIDPAGLPYLCVVLLGIGQGSSFPIALTMFVLRTRTPDLTQQLSSMAQTIGYLIAALGPLLFGVLHDVSNGWTVPIVLLLAVIAPQIVSGVAAAQPRFAGERA